jgi:Domain of unknown function (DUF4167)
MQTGHVSKRRPRPMGSSAARSTGTNTGAARSNGSQSAQRSYERYLALAQDEARSGNVVGAENYYQHAEHFFRLILEPRNDIKPAPAHPALGQPAHQQAGDRGGLVANLCGPIKPFHIRARFFGNLVPTKIRMKPLPKGGPLSGHEGTRILLFNIVDKNHNRQPPSPVLSGAPPWNFFGHAKFQA